MYGAVAPAPGGPGAAVARAAKRAKWRRNVFIGVVLGTLFAAVALKSAGLARDPAAALEPEPQLAAAAPHLVPPKPPKPPPLPAVASCDCGDADGPACVACSVDGDCSSNELPALMGYDVVAYFSLVHGTDCAVLGSAAFAAEYDGLQWWFSTAENRDLFVAEPTKFAPQFGGFCALGIAAETAWSAEHLGPPVAVWDDSGLYCRDSYVVADGKLYLFNVNAYTKWSSDQAGYIAAANARWLDWFPTTATAGKWNTDAYGIKAGVCIGSSLVDSCCSCDAALGYGCPLDV
ncbi:hypothetical protein M885DRAFT_495609 [Pelagophyceae sp. CCMP2097]|nr:hypothetical protein M885DRAFT_495609 [Pelagophyceae sp. CCMP2097]